MRGQPIPPPINLNPEQVEFIVALYREGKALRAIEAQLWDSYRVKCGRMTVRKILMNQGVRMRSNRYDRHGGQPLTRYERISFFVPQEHKKLLARFGRGRYGTLSEYVRDIIRQELDRQEAFLAQRRRGGGAAEEASPPSSGTASTPSPAPGQSAPAPTS